MSSLAYRYLKAILLLLSLIFLISGSEAQADQGYFFKQISLNEGLTQSTVRCVLNDRNGLIWIGTRSGLNRFDRYSIKSYVYKKNDPASIPGNQIIFIHEDRDGQIWVGTENGLALYDALKDNFKVLKLSDKPVIVQSVEETPDGLFFGGGGEIIKFNRELKELEVMRLKTKVKAFEMFNGMKAWKNQILLYTRRSGVWVFNPKLKTLEPVSFIREKEIMALYVDRKQQIWLSAFYGRGIERYDQHGKLQAHYDTKNSGLTHDIVLDMLEHDQKLWIATDGGGLNMLDLKSNTFSALKHVPGKSSSFPENSIISLNVDAEDNLWAGSVRGGLISIRKAFSNTYREAPLNSVHGLSARTVLSLVEDQQTMIWIGTDGGGLNRFDPKTLQFKHYPATYGMKVASLTDFNARYLLISAFSRGLYLFDKSTGAIEPYLLDKIGDQGKIIKSSGIAVNVHKVSADFIYLSTDQIFRYHLPDQELKLADYGSTKIRNNILLKIATDGQRTFLFGPYHIVQLDHVSNKISTVVRLNEDGNPITAVARDGNGIFWIGNRDGLMAYDPAKKSLRRIKTSLFNEVSTIVADRSGRLWIGAQQMVFAYLINENKFLAFGESDGVVPNEFLYKPNLVASTGDIYMGGVRGLLHIQKNIPAIRADVPVMSVMGLELNGVPLILNRNNKDDVVEIPWNHTSLVMKIMAREKDVFRKKMFRYQIIGLDAQVIETYDHAISLGSLPIGSYRILVSSGLKNGGWSEYTEVMKLKVPAPWFKSIWFLGLVLIGVLVVIRILYQNAIAKRERKLDWDMKVYEQQSYEAKIKFLINISHELRTPLTLIYSPLQRILKNMHPNAELQPKLMGVFRQATHMKEIIDMVLDVRKTEQAEDALILKRQELNSWIREVGAHFSQEFENKGIEMVYELDERIGDFIFDVKKCELILMNLLANALKFSRKDTLLTICTELRQQCIRISVIDEGIGLDHLDTAKLFKPFYQGTHAEHGSGIGLSFAKILTEMQGGNIGAEANSKGGATFYFELPVRMETNSLSEVLPVQPGSWPAHVNQTGTEGTDQASGTSVYTILIVEDEPELRAFLVDQLKSHFKLVLDAGDGITALELLMRERPDIVLSDVMMPGLDGFEFCKRLKEDLNVSHIPLVLLTTQNDAESRKIGYKLGADAYVAKPFDLDFLQTLLANLLRNREAVKQKYKESNLRIAVKAHTFSSADEVFMQKLNELISENLHLENLHVDFLTDKMAMSRASLYSKLKAVADIGVNDYINKFRLEKAAYLLSHSDLSMMDIADAVGFANQRYFSTVFKQYYLTTPSLYRKENSVKKG